MYSNNRDSYRQAFFITWQKYLKKLPLTATEKQLVAAMILHPEYTALLESDATKQEFLIEENPFVHLSLHIAIQEQIHLDRPAGIKDIYQSLLKMGDEHTAQHLMMEQLGKMMWEAQQTGNPPNEEDYLARLRAMLIK